VAGDEAEREARLLMIALPHTPAWEWRIEAHLWSCVAAAACLAARARGRGAVRLRTAGRWRRCLHSNDDARMMRGGGTRIGRSSWCEPLKCTPD